MSKELSTYEAIGGTYTEMDGVLYPNITVSEGADVCVGKYGLLGLPLKWVQAQRESFKKYLTRERYVSLKYKKVSYLIEIVDCTVMPQGYAAVAENLKDFKGMNLLVDIGNGTMNVMYLNNGRPIESKSWTEKLGVNQCFIRIQNHIMNQT